MGRRRRDVAKKLPSREELRRWFDYDPAVGMKWVQMAGRRAPVGTVCRGPKTVVPGVGEFQTTHIIWKLATGEDVPDDRIVDHHDRDHFNHKLANLRLATSSQNNVNSDKPNKRSENGSWEFPVRGVRVLSRPHRPMRCYAWIKIGGKIVERSAIFDNIEQAKAARRDLMIKYYGPFALDAER